MNCSQAGTDCPLLGYIFYKAPSCREACRGAKCRWRRSPVSSQTSLGENSVFATQVGERRYLAHAAADGFQWQVCTIDTDEVDPVAKPMSWLMAGMRRPEEILLRSKDQRPALVIHLKLLEITPTARAQKQFESLATELYGETGGVSCRLEKAAMGLKVDPQNPLYGGRGPSEAAEFRFDANGIVSAQKRQEHGDDAWSAGDRYGCRSAAGGFCSELPVDVAEAAPAAEPEPDFDLEPGTKSVEDKPKSGSGCHGYLAGSPFGRE